MNKKVIISLMKDEAGQGMSEYGLILALVVIAVITALGLMKDQVVALYTNATEGLEFAATSI